MDDLKPYIKVMYFSNRSFDCSYYFLNINLNRAILMVGLLYYAKLILSHYA